MESVQDPLRFTDLAIDGEPSEEIALDDDTNSKQQAEEAETTAALVDPLQAPPPTQNGGTSSSSSSTTRSIPQITSHNALTDSSTLENVDLGKSDDDISASLREPAAPTFNESAVSPRRGGSGGGAGPSSSAATPAGAQRTGALIHLTVTDPVKLVSDHSFIPGLKSSHYEYLVTCTPLENAAAAAGIPPWPRAEVRRRFKDFVALADLLSETHRGYFLYPRPDKGAIEAKAAGHTDSEFVEMRRVELERYLRRLAAHPIAGQSEELRVFLTAEGSLAASWPWRQLLPLRGSLAEGVARLPRQLLGSETSIPTTADVAKNPRHTNDLMRRLREMGERMRQEYQAPRELSPDEVSLRETKAGVEAYADVLSNASRRAEKVLREFEKLGAAEGAMGLSLMRLAVFEEKQSDSLGRYTPIGAAAITSAADARLVGTAEVRTSRICRPATAESVIALQPVHDELALAPAVVAALQEREAALLTVQSIGDDVEKRKFALEVLENGDGAGGVVPGDPAKVRKAQSMRNEIASLEAAVEAAQAEYEKIKERNEGELQRWREQRCDALAGMVHRFAAVQAEYYEREVEDLRPVIAQKRTEE